MKGRLAHRWLLRRLARDRRGASAIEFSVIAPIIAAGLLSTVDLGRAINERISLDNLLRVGTRIAMTDPGAGVVRAAIGVADDSQSHSNDRSALSLDVLRYCACPDDSASALPCSTTCAGSAPTAIFYRLTSTATFDGMLLPPISIGADSRVRIR